MNDLDRSPGNVLDVLEKQHKELLAIHSTIGVAIGALKQQQGQIDQLDRRLDDVHREMSIVANHYTVSAWVGWHGFKMTEEATQQEGILLRRICDAWGIVYPQQKVCSGGRYAVRMWPMEAIRIWWPDCCRRYGWILKWNRP